MRTSTRAVSLGTPRMVRMSIGVLGRSDSRSLDKRIVGKDRDFAMERCRFRLFLQGVELGSLNGRASLEVMSRWVCTGMRGSAKDGRIFWCSGRVDETRRGYHMSRNVDRSDCGKRSSRATNRDVRRNRSGSDRHLSEGTSVRAGHRLIGWGNRNDLIMKS